MYDVEYLSSPHMRALIDGAKVFYSTGFFLTHGTAIALELAKQVASANKVRQLATP
jgi:adenosine kinase